MHNTLVVRTSQLAPRIILERSSAAIDVAIEVLLVCILFFLPLALGAVEPWSESIALVLGALISLLLIVRVCVRPGEGIPPSAAFVPLLAYVLLIVAQMLPLPAVVVRLLSPHTVSMKAQLLSDLPQATARLRHVTLSFYPTATAHDLRIIALAITIFVAVLLVYRTAARIRRLLAAIAIIGGLLALLALAQDFSGATGIYWCIPLEDLPWYGTFVAHAHFGQHMNLSLGAAIGLLASLPSNMGKLRRRDVFVRAGLAIIIAAGAAAVVLSRTRTGTIALVASGLLAVMVIVMRRGLNRRLIIGCVVGAVLIAVPIICGLDRVYSRMATLQQPNEYFLRVTTNKDIFGIWRQFPVFGTGLGTHQTFYPRFDSTMMTGLSTHAENDYAEAAEETGLIGLGCVIAFALLVWREWKLAAFTPGPDICLAAAGLGFGFLAVQIQSVSDFGQHIPAPAALTAVTCGLIINLRRIAVPSRNLITRGVGARRWINAGFLGVFAVAAFALWALFTSAKALEAAPYVTQARDLAETAKSESGATAEQDYSDLIELASKAAAADPDDVFHRYWLDLYRWRAVEQLSAVDDLGTDPKARAAVADIVNDLSQARTLCPTYGSIYSLMGQLEYYVLHSPSAGAHLQTAALLAPHEPACCFLAGSLDASDGKWDSATRKFRLAYKFAPGMTDDIIGVYVTHGRPELAADVGNDDYEWLARVSEVVTDKEVSAKARLRAIDLLQPICAGDNAQGAQLARLASLYSAGGQDAAAIDCYQMALAREGDRAEWYLGEAEAFRRLGRDVEARNAAYLSLRLQPDLTKARELVRSLSRDLGN
jgi:O-antigen ligase/tetratricopeptide (TPR) repeat protein